MSSRFRRPENQPDFLPRPSVGRARAAGDELPAGAVLRPADQDVSPGQHLLRHAPRAVRAPTRTKRSTATACSAARIGWINTRILDETGDEAAAQGWCMPYYDIERQRQDRGGRRPLCVRALSGGRAASSPVMRIPAGVIYSVIAHPTDGTVWGAVPGPMPGRIIRIDPKTCVSEVYEPPFNNPEVNVNGYTPRGIDVDSYGVIWTALAGSGHLASFDRRKCRVLTGPAATTASALPRRLDAVSDAGPAASRARPTRSPSTCTTTTSSIGSTRSASGSNVPLANGTNSDSLLALLPDGRWVVLRVPYPLGFFSRGMDGRIDDPERRLEGAGALCRLRPERRLAHRGRQRHAQLADQVSTASRSACQVIVWSSARRCRAAIAAALLCFAASSAARRHRRDLAGPLESTIPRGFARARSRPRDRRLHGLAGQRRRAPARGFVGCGEVDDAGAAVRAAPGRLRAARSRGVAHRQHRRSDLAGRDLMGHHRHVDAAAPQDLHGRPPAPVAERAAQLAGLFDRRVGRRHAQGDDDAFEGRLGAAQRFAAQRQSDARRVLHSQRELPDARHRRDGSRSI